jgi:hypothetical protein
MWASWFRYIRIEKTWVRVGGGEKPRDHTEKKFSWLPQEQTVEEASGLLQAVQETVISHVPRQVKYKLGIFFAGTFLSR